MMTIDDSDGLSAKQGQCHASPGNRRAFGGSARKPLSRTRDSPVHAKGHYGPRGAPSPPGASAGPPGEALSEAADLTRAHSTPKNTWLPMGERPLLGGPALLGSPGPGYPQGRDRAPGRHGKEASGAQDEARKPKAKKSG